MGNNLAVKITADIQDLSVKFAVAKAEVNALTAEMNKLARATAAGTINPAGEARIQQVAGDMLHARDAAAQLAAQMRSVEGSSGGLGGAVEGLSNKLSAAFKFTGIALAAEGIRGLGAAIAELGGRAAEIRSTADVLGVTVEQFQAMSAAAEAAGVSSETLARLSERLTGHFQQARDGSGAAAEKLKALGFSNEQIASTSFGANEALGVLHARLMDAATAGETHNRILAEFGPRGANAIEVLRAYSGSAADVAARMAALNGLTAAQTASAANLYSSYKEFGTWLQNTFTKSLDAAAEGLSRAYEASSRSMVRGGGATPEVPSVAPLVRSDAAQAQAALAEITVTARATTAADLESIRERVAAERSGTAERLAAVRQLYTASLQFYGSAQIDKVREVARQLAAEGRAHAEEQIRLSEETSRKQIEADNLRIRSIKAVNEENQRYLDEQRSIAVSAISTDMAIARQGLEAKKNILGQELSAHQINASQWLATELQLTTELAALDIQELERKKALYATEPAEAARIADQIRLIRAKLNTDLAAIDRQGAAAAQREAHQEVTDWQKAVGEIGNAEATMLGDLLSKRKSFRQSALAVAGQFVQQELANDARAITTKILLQEQGAATDKSIEQGGFLFHLLSEHQKAGATAQSQAEQTAAVTAGAQARAIATQAAAVESKAAQNAINGPTIMADAAKAFSGTYASVSAIPLVGWVLAPFAAAGAYAAVAAYEGAASLDVGAWNVPREMMARIHPGETVLPRDYASGHRAAVASGGSTAGGGSGGRGGGDIHHHHYNVSAWDSESVAKWMSKPQNRDLLHDALRTRYNRGGR